MTDDEALFITCPRCGWVTYIFSVNVKAQRHPRHYLKLNLRHHLKRAHPIMGARETSTTVDMAEIRVYTGGGDG